MTLIQKIKTYFIKYEFYSWKGFDWRHYDFTFDVLTDEILLDLGIYLNHNLTAANQIGNKRYRMQEASAICHENLDGLLPFVRTIINNDRSQTSIEADKHGWDFRYFIAEHPKCENTLRICNGLRTKNGVQGCCVYPLITIRKFNNRYYCWNHTN